MNEERLAHALRALDQPVTPDPLFGDALYTRLVRRPRRKRPSTLRVALAAALLLALAAAVLLVGASRRPTPLPPVANGLIAWDDQNTIYVVDPGGGDAPVPITGGAGADFAPAFSPDGTHLAFWSSDHGAGRPGDGSRQLFVWPLAGSREPRPINGAVTPWDPSFVAPAWSPDSTRIAFAGLHPATGVSLYVAHVDGREPTKIVEGGAGFRDVVPAWSPDGRTVAYRDGSSASGETALMVATLDGAPPRLVATAATRGISYGAKSWSPDGRQITYERKGSDASGDYVVAVADIQTGSERVVSRGEAGGHFPVWSPDGAWIAYFEGRPGTSDAPNVVLVTPDGSTRRDLGPVGDCHMEWSPDARFILAHAPGCKGSLVIVPVADPGLGVRALDLPERMRESITWQRVIP